MTDYQYDTGLAVYYATYIARHVAHCGRYARLSCLSLGLLPLNQRQADRVVVDSEIPSNLVLRKISPKIWLPALTIMWGIVTMCLGFVRSYAGFMAVRAILGITEGGLLPGIVS
jgi:hypothetical protein